MEIIKKLTFRGDATRNMFRAAQQHVFRDMEKSVWVEFIKSRTPDECRALAMLTQHVPGRCGLSVEASPTAAGGGAAGRGAGGGAASVGPDWASSPSKSGRSAKVSPNAAKSPLSRRGSNSEMSLKG